MPSLTDRMRLILAISLFMLLTAAANGQIIIKELRSHLDKDLRENLFERSPQREFINLNGTWQVYSASAEEIRKTRITVPSVFEGNDDLVFEKYFALSPAQLSRGNFRLFFLGINYTAEISVNNSLVYRHSGGAYPFSCDVPKDLLTATDRNLVTVRISPKLDTRSTFPLKFGYLQPNYAAGIFRDVTLQVSPAATIADYHYSVSGNGTNRFSVTVQALVYNRDFSGMADSSGSADNFELRAVVRSSNGDAAGSSTAFTLKRGKEREAVCTAVADNAPLWTPENPVTATLAIQLFRGGQLVDESVRSISFYTLGVAGGRLSLNGTPYQLRGVTYVPAYYNNGSMASNYRMQSDIAMMKALGANSVKISRGFAHPGFLLECERQGLLVFLDAPLATVPSAFMEDGTYTQRAKNLIRQFTRAYSMYSCVAAFGAGTGYLGGNPQDIFFLGELSTVFRNSGARAVYASFSPSAVKPVSGIDFYGVELMNQDAAAAYRLFEQAGSGIEPGRCFVSEAGYLATLGNSTGYSNQHTNEAQAKFFQDFLEQAEDKGSPFFLHTMFSYRSGMQSVIAGYSPEQIIPAGICPEDRTTGSLSYKVIYNRWHILDKVTVPPGLKKDSSQMAFVIASLLFALVVGFLFNSGRKFREDALRALTRPYNFFQDVRDLRIISGMQTSVLAVLTSGVMATLTVSILHSMRFNPWLERIAGAPGSAFLSSTVSYLAWHPVPAMLVLTGVFYAKLLGLSLLIRLGSVFVLNRVTIINAYSTAIWSAVPFVLLLPFTMVSYRLLAAGTFTVPFYMLLGLVLLWILHRLLKGIHVIYDVTAGKVYFYSLLVLVMTGTVLLLYLQHAYTLLDTLARVYQEYQAVQALL